MCRVKLFKCNIKVHLSYQCEMIFYILAMLCDDVENVMLKIQRVLIILSYRS